MDEHVEANNDDNSETSSQVANTWNSAQEELLKAISERSNCMRWLHTQCSYHFDTMNFYLTIPNIVLSAVNGGFTMSLRSVFPDESTQHFATTVIGLISILSAVLTTLNQYIKSQQMMETHRAAAISYGKLNRNINNELALRRDQRTNALEFLKIVRIEQDRLEMTAPSILPTVILKFNKEFANHDLEKPEIAGDLDQTTVNRRGKSANTFLSARVVPLSIHHSASSNTILRKVHSYTHSHSPTNDAPSSIKVVASTPP